MEANTIDISLKHELEIAKKLIDTADLSSTINRLIRIEKWSRKEALEAIKQYRNFLFLKRKYGESHMLPPSYDIDEVWHAHILHTEEYHNFCQSVFGKFLHHHPHHGHNKEISNEELTLAFENETQKFYETEFKESIQNVRPLPFRFIVKQFFVFIKDKIKNNSPDKFCK